MFKHSISCGSLIAVIAAASAGYGQGASPQHSANHGVVPIVADVASTITVSAPSARGFNHTHNGRYFRSRDGKVREDLVFGSIITDSITKTATFLNHAKKEATVVAMSDPDVADLDSVKEARNPAKNHNDARITHLGEDKVEGHPVHKKLIEAGSASTMPGRKSEIWTATDIQLPVFVKTTGADRTTTREYRNIQVADPDPQVFEIPKEYRIVDKSQFTPPLLLRR